MSPEAPEVEAEKRVVELSQAIDLLEKEYRTLSGRVRNLNPEETQKIQADNAALKVRVNQLELLVEGVIEALHTDHNPAERAQTLENLQKSTIQLCNQLNLDTALWKNIVS